MYLYTVPEKVGRTRRSRIVSSRDELPLPVKVRTSVCRSAPILSTKSPSPDRTVNPLGPTVTRPTSSAGTVGMVPAATPALLGRCEPVCADGVVSACGGATGGADWFTASQQ